MLIVNDKSHKGSVTSRMTLWIMAKSVSALIKVKANGIHQHEFPVELILVLLVTSCLCFPNIFLDQSW